MRDFINITACMHLVESALIHLQEDTFDAAAFIVKINAVKQLIKRGGTPGEKAAAAAALDRLTKRAKAEIHHLPKSQQRALLQALKMSNGSERSARPAQPRPTREAKPFTVPHPGQIVVFRSANGIIADVTCQLGKYMVVLKSAVEREGKWHIDPYTADFANKNGFYVQRYRDLTEDQVKTLADKYDLSPIYTGASSS